MKSARGRAPRAARAVIERALPAEDRALVDELDALFAQRAARRGLVRARLWYWREALGFALRLGVVRLWEVCRGFAAGMQLRQIVTGFRRRPAWTLGVASTLALGIGGLATVFGVANWVLLRPVPGVRDAAALVTLRIGSSRDPAQVSYRLSHRDYTILQEQLTTLDGLAASAPFDAHVQLGGAPARRLSAELITTNYFEVLGASLSAGRAFSLAEGASADGAPVVIVSHALAREIAGDAARAVGTTVRVNGRDVDVAGVAPPGFAGANLPGTASLWFPFGAYRLLNPGAPANAGERPGHGVWRMLYGRAAGTAGLAAIQEQATQVAARIREQGGPHSFIPTHFRLQAFDGVGLDPGIRASVGATLRLMTVSALLLLTLAVANVVNLSIIESLQRRSAMAVRFSLGARMRHVVANWLTESSALALIAAVFALLVARALGVIFAQTRLSDGGASLQGLQFDVRVVAFTFAIALVSALLAGLPVLLAASRTGTLATLARSRSVERGSQRIRGAFVIVQVALSVMLVTGAGLLGRTVMNLRAIDLGFEVDDVTVFTLDPTPNQYGAADVAALIDRLERRLSAHAEIETLGFVSPEPLAGWFVTDGIIPDGASVQDGAIVGAGYRVTPAFMAALAPRLLAGEFPVTPDPASIVISASLAARAFPGIPPALVAGRRIRGREEGNPLLRIAAVIEDVELNGVPDPRGMNRLTILRSYEPDATGPVAITGWVRSRAGASRMTAVITDAVRAEAPDLPIHRIQSARSATDQLSADRFVLARIAFVLSALGLLLAGVGLYAAIGCIVQQRMREIGIRAALGASPANLLGTVTGRGIGLAGAGAATGLLGAVALARGLQSHLFGITAFHLPIYISSTLVVVVCAAIASAFPARRAARVSPLEVIRSE